ncbi:helix-turn-helix domain-containing protein [Microbulbifer agarilyticus]|uniref:helix-turn-helix domain-containing protein n=1 Tax=Microbulbifer agarilyticus TaxID=260552 RepID=UPI001C96323C|nr:helix-turn-helix domain-containing protein [Microbulbifer agarilyticus]MBY6211016.1 helix-turn-helix domain-containing protein [Microbulbifer agarilyticus]
MAVWQDRQLLDEALELMCNNLAEPLRTAELAAYLDISVKKLERIFSRFKGILPARFYRELRLQHARVLLLESEQSIDAIGQLCGFRSASHFSRCFKEHFGRSPRGERMFGEPSDAALQFCVDLPKLKHFRVGVSL